MLSPTRRPAAVAVSLLITALPLALVGPWVVGHLVRGLRKAGTDPADAGPVLARVAEQPLWIAVPAVAGIACAVIALTTKRAALPMIVAGAVCVLAGFLALLFCFVGLLAPLYTAPEL
ncbi:MAG: hypothetical protein ACYTG1_03535 [Planctomycetota bacterium]|jgi:DMSO reductase anchor subunit